MSFISEVKEQSTCLDKLVGHYSSKNGERLLDKASKMISNTYTRSIIFLGMGTSSIVPLIIRDILVNKTTIVPSIWDAGEFLHYAINSVTNDDVIIGISQSGESIETRKCLQSLKRHRRIITITNNSDSTMARLSRLNLPILAGKETSVSNKTYTNTAGLLLLLGNKIAVKPTASLLKELSVCAKEMDNFFSRRRGEIDEATNFLKSANSLSFIARGAGTVAAMQATLTWMEGVRMSATAFSGGSFRHGPFELVSKGHYAVCFAPEGHGGRLVEKMSKEMAKLGSKVVVFSGRNTRKEKNLFVIKIKPTAERTFPIAAAVPQELLLANMAQARGLVPGRFARIGKITGVE